MKKKARRETEDGRRKKERFNPPQADKGSIVQGKNGKKSVSVKKEQGKWKKEDGRRKMTSP